MILTEWYEVPALIAYVIIWMPWVWQCRMDPYLRSSYYWSVNSFAGPVALFCQIIVGLAGSMDEVLIWGPILTALGIWNYRTWLRHKDDKNPNGGKKFRALVPVRVKGN